MKSVALKALNYQFKTEVNIGTKTSILALTKTFFILLVSCCVLSCSTELHESQETRKYTVSLSTSLWDIYECDSIIWINDTHFKLKNNEDKESFIEFFIQKGTEVRVLSNGN